MRINHPSSITQSYHGCGCFPRDEQAYWCHEAAEGDDDAALGNTAPFGSDATLSPLASVYRPSNLGTLYGGGSDSMAFLKERYPAQFWNLCVVVCRILF